MEKAYNELKNIDEKDTPFLALAFQIECPMWSDDHHLHQQSKIKVYNTKEIVNLFEKREYEWNTCVNRRIGSNM